MPEAKPYLPAENSDVCALFDEEHLNEVWARRDEATDIEYLNGPSDPAAVSNNQFANRDGQLLLVEVSRQQEVTVLWNFGPFV